MGLWSRCIVDGCVDVDDEARREERGEKKRRYEGGEM